MNFLSRIMLNLAPWACLMAALGACEPAASPETALTDTMAQTQEKKDTVPMYRNIREYPHKEMLHLEVMMTGFFHRDEIWPDVRQKSWVGLFRINDNYYLKSAQLNIQRVYDPTIESNPSVKSGWEIRTIQPDTAILLIAKYAKLPERKVNAIPLPQDEFNPGDTLNFLYHTIPYRLFARGMSKKSIIAGAADTISNYQLLIETADHRKRSLLAAVPGFDNQMMKIWFAGDLDADSIPDFIINTASHYNMTRPALYLSTKAGPHQVVAPVGIFKTEGGIEEKIRQ